MGGDGSDGSGGIGSDAGIGGANDPGNEGNQSGNDASMSGAVSGDSSDSSDAAGNLAAAQAADMDAPSQDFGQMADSAFGQFGQVGPGISAPGNMSVSAADVGAFDSAFGIAPSQSFGQFGVAVNADPGTNMGFQGPPAPSLGDQGKGALADAMNAQFGVQAPVSQAEATPAPDTSVFGSPTGVSAPSLGAPGMGIPGVGGFGNLGAPGTGIGALGNEQGIAAPSDGQFGGIAGIGPSATGPGMSAPAVSVAGASLGIGSDATAAPGPAADDEPTAAQDQADMAAANAKAVALGYMNPDGTTGKNATTTSESLGKGPAVASLGIGSDAAAQGAHASETAANEDDEAQAAENAAGVGKGLNPSAPDATDTTAQSLADQASLAAKAALAQNQPANDFGNLSEEFGNFPTAQVSNPAVDAINNAAFGQHAPPSVPAASTPTNAELGLPENDFGNLSSEFGSFGKSSVPGVSVTNNSGLSGLSPSALGFSAVSSASPAAAPSAAPAVNDVAPSAPPAVAAPSAAAPASVASIGTGLSLSPGANTGAFDAGGNLSALGGGPSTSILLAEYPWLRNQVPLKKIA